MTKIDQATAPFVEAEIKGRQAALIRQMVAAEIIICVVFVLVKTASLIIDTARSVAGLLSTTFESPISP